MRLNDHVKVSNGAGGNVGYDGPMCESTPRAYFDVTLDSLFSAVSDYHMNLDRMEEILYGEYPKTVADTTVPTKVLEAIRMLTDRIEENNKRLQSFKENLSEHFGQLKL